MSVLYYLFYGAVLAIEGYLISFCAGGRGDALIFPLLLAAGILLLIAFLLLDLRRGKPQHKLFVLLAQSLFGLWSVVQYGKASAMHISCNDYPEVYPPDDSHFIFVWFVGYGLSVYLITTMLLKRK